MSEATLVQLTCGICSTLLCSLASRRSEAATRSGRPSSTASARGRGRPASSSASTLPAFAARSTACKA